MKQRDQIREAAVAVAFAAAQVDGELSPPSREVLESFRQHWGYESEAAVTAFWDAWHHPRVAWTELQVSPTEAALLMGYALEVALSDGFLSQAEVAFLQRLAEVLRLPGDDLQRLMQPYEQRWLGQGAR